MIQDTVRNFIDQLTKGFGEGSEEDKEEIIPYGTTVDNLALSPDIESEMKSAPLKAMDSKVVTHAAFNKNTNSAGMVICEPRAFREAVEYVKHLKEHKIVLVNVSLLEQVEAFRLVDFMCGAAHALNGTEQQIGGNVFAFAPMGVPISTEVQTDKKVKDVLWVNQ